MQNHKTSQLQENLLFLRKQIVESISSSLPKGYLAMGPVLIFIEDPNMRCLYNWSNVSWSELSVGMLAKEIIRDIYDITHFLKNKKNLLEIKKLGNSIEDIKKIENDCSLFLKKDIDYCFDDFPVFEEKFKGFPEFIKRVEKNFEALKNLSKDTLNKLEQHSISFQHVRHSQLPNLLERVYKITNGRYKAFRKLQEVIREYDDLKIEGIGEFISNHPRYAVKEKRVDAKKRWKGFLKDIKGYDPEMDKADAESSKYYSLMKTAIEVFCDLPQETYSSLAFEKIKEKNTQEYNTRSDISDITLADIVHHPPEGRKYKTEKLKHYALYGLTHYFERLFYFDLAPSKETSAILNIIFLPVKFIDSQVIGQIVVISTEPINKNIIINSTEAYSPKIREAARSGFKARIISEAIDDSERINAPFDETGYLAQYISKILSNKGFAILKKNSNNSWMLCRRTKTVSLSDINHEILELDHILRDKQNDFQVFINWFESQLTKKITQENECYNIFSIYKDNPAKMAFKQLLGGNANKVLKKEGYPKSCFIALLKREISVAVFFEEDEMVMGLSGHEIFSLMNDISEQLLLLKGKKTATNYKMIASQMAHDAKHLNGIISNIDKLISETHGTVKDTLEIVELPLVDFRDQLTFILAAYHPDYESEIGTYKRKERKSYVLADEIKKILNELLTESHIRVLKNKISSGKGNPLKGNRLMAIWNSLGRNILEFELENDILTQLNILSLRIILRGLFQNAITHTDWENNIFDVPPKAPSIVKIECIKNISTIKLRVSNIPKEKDKVRTDLPEVFFEYASSPHIIMIGKAVEVSTGGKNIRFINCQEDSKYISVEICIPIK